MTPSLPIIRTLLSAALTAVFISNAFGIGFDTTFGSSGKFMTSFADVGQPSAYGGEVFMQPSDRILVVGGHSQQGTTARTVGFAIAGLTLGGSLDATFGTAGKVLVWNPTANNYRTNSILLADSSLLVLFQKWESAATNRPEILKFTAAGALDSSFVPDLDLFANQTAPVRIARASGGKIYVVVRNGDQHYLIRLNANGSRDTTFGPNGVRSINLNRFATQPRLISLEELPDGKLLVVGRYTTPRFEDSLFIARLDTDTNLDRSFGQQGAARINIPFGSTIGVTVKAQPDGKVLVGGCWTFLGSNTLLIRLTARGRLDPSFGTGGMVQTSFNNTNIINGITIAPDGTIFATGSSGAKAFPSNQRLFVIRYSSAGVNEGSIVTNFIGTREAGASDIFLQADGRLLIAGYTQNPSDTNTQLAAARFNQ